MFVQVVQRLDADDGDAQLVGQADHFVLLEHDHFARREREATGAGGVQHADGVDAHGGNVSPAVVAHAGGFDECPALGPAQAAGTLDHAVGAFDGFDGDDVTFAHGDGLADVQAQQRGHLGPGPLDVA